MKTKVGILTLMTGGGIGFGVLSFYNEDANPTRHLFQIFLGKSGFTLGVLYLNISVW